MPRIPFTTLSPQGPAAPITQGPQVVPVQSETPEVLQRTGGGLQDVGIGVYRLGQTVRARHDTARTQQAVNRLEEFRDNLLSPKEGYLSRRGEDAGNDYDATREALKQEVSRLSGLLDNDDQRAKFAEIANDVQLRANRTIDTHAGRESYRFELSQREANLVSLERQWSETLTMPEEGQDQAYQDLEGRIRRQAANVAKMRGEAPEKGEQLAEQIMSRAHSTSVSQLLDDDNPEGASLYLKDYGEDIDPDTRRELKARVSAKSAARESAIRVGRMWSQTRGADTEMQQVRVYAKLHDEFLAGNRTAEQYRQDKNAARALFEQQRRVEIAQLSQASSAVRARLSDPSRPAPRTLADFPQYVQEMAQRHPDEFGDPLQATLNDRTKADAKRRLNEALDMPLSDFKAAYGGALVDDSGQPVDVLSARFPGLSAPQMQQLRDRLDLAEGRMTPGAAYEAGKDMIWQRLLKGRHWAYVDREGNMMAPDSALSEPGVTPNADIVAGVQQYVKTLVGDNRGVSVPELRSSIDKWLNESNITVDTANLPDDLFSLLPAEVAARAVVATQYGPQSALDIRDAMGSEALTKEYKYLMGRNWSQEEQREMSQGLGNPKSVAVLRERWQRMKLGDQPVGQEHPVRVRELKRRASEEVMAAFGTMFRDPPDSEEALAELRPGGEGLLSFLTALPGARSMNPRYFQLDLAPVALERLDNDKDREMLQSMIRAAVREGYGKSLIDQIEHSVRSDLRN